MENHTYLFDYFICHLITYFLELLTTMRLDNDLALVFISFAKSIVNFNSIWCMIFYLVLFRYARNYFEKESNLTKSLTGFSKKIFG